MKIELASEEIAYFDKNGYIEFYGLLQDREEEALLEALHKELQKRISHNKELKGDYNPHKQFSSLYDIQSQDLFEFGRDTCLSSSSIQKILFGKKIAETASLLMNLKPLRWGFDQLTTEQECRFGIENGYSLEESISIQGLVIGCLLLFSSEKGMKNHSILFFKSIQRTDIISNQHSFFSKKSLTNISDRPALLFGYTHKCPLYIANDRDPHMHALKKQGYGFGDQLREKTHPSVYR